MRKCFRWIQTVVLLVAGLLVFCGCNQQKGGSQGDNNPPVTGRGSGESGDSGGNGKVYDRGGPPGSANPTRQTPGSGRIDQGGGKTAGGAVDNSVPTNSYSPPPSGAGNGQQQ